MLSLAALWGASFLFLRIAAPVVGPVVVAAFRVTLAAVVLLPFAWAHRPAAPPRAWLPALALSGLLSCVLPFIGLSQAARSLPAGLLSILNATTPLWGALVGWLWTKESMPRSRAAGLMLGFGGIAWLSLSGGGLNGHWSWAPVALALGSTLMYALAVHHSKLYLSNLPPIVVTTGCLMAASAVLFGPALWIGPVGAPQSVMAWHAIPTETWAALIGLAIGCTAIAYLLFFRLIQEIGASRALTVTFLIPIFGMAWGALFLDETITREMLICTAVVVIGTQLSNRQA